MIRAGIKIGQIEFHYDGHNFFVFHQNIKYTIETAPDIFLDLLDQQMNSATRFGEIFQQFKIDSPAQQRRQFLKCNCSIYQSTPFNENSQIAGNKLIECPFSHSCSYEGKLCKVTKVMGNKVTISAIRLASLIRKKVTDHHLNTRGWEHLRDHVPAWIELKN